MSNKEVVDYIKSSFDLKNQGYYKPAIEMLYKALSIESDNVEILSQLAHLYKLMDNHARATYYVEKALEVTPNHLDSLLLLKEISELQQNYIKAKEITEAIFELQPVSKNLAEKVRIFNILKEMDAIKEIENSGRDLDEEVLYEIAFAYFQNGDLNKALELLELGYQKNNKNPRILLLLAKICYGSKDFEKSKKIFSELEKIHPDAEVMNYIGLFSLNEQNYTKAVKYFLKACDADRSNAEYSYNLASAYFMQGWGDEALKYFTQAISLAPENLDYHYALAFLYYQKKMYSKANLELDFIDTIDGNHQYSRVLKALVMGKQGDLLNAKSQLESIIENNSEDDFAMASLSKIYKELSQIDMAEKFIKQALQLNPDSLDYLSDLIEIEIEQNNFDEALKLIEKVLKLNENYVYAYIALARVKFMQKDFAQVFEAAQNIIELDPNCTEGYYYNALALFEQNDVYFAIESLKKAITLDLNNDMLYVKMSEFYQELGDFKTAYQWAKEASEINLQSYQNKWLCAKLAIVLKDDKEAVKFYSQAYRLAPYDKDLILDYTSYLSSIGNEKQAKSILKISEKNNLINKNLSLK